ncbi:nucleotide-binding protein [Nocardiopsis gilva]|nr:AAA family ATPase [Nocardiopsis gilva]
MGTTADPYEPIQAPDQTAFDDVPEPEQLPPLEQPAAEQPPAADPAPLDAPAEAPVEGFAEAPADPVAEEAPPATPLPPAEQAERFEQAPAQPPESDPAVQGPALQGPPSGPQVPPHLPNGQSTPNQNAPAYPEQPQPYPPYPSPGPQQPPHPQQPGPGPQYTGPQTPYPGPPRPTGPHQAGPYQQGPHQQGPRQQGPQQHPHHPGPPTQQPGPGGPQQYPGPQQTGPQHPHPHQPGPQQPGPHHAGPQQPQQQPGPPPVGPPQGYPTGGQPPMGPNNPWGGPQQQVTPGPAAHPPTGGHPFQYRAHIAGESEGTQGGSSETSDMLDADSLVRNRPKPSATGWRKVVQSATFGLVNPGESANEVRRRELTARATTHVAGGHHRVAVLSLKGGVGKTTTTVALGSMLSSLRGDRVLAVDANPDRGTLSDKVRLQTAATIRDLLNERDSIRRYADIRGFTSQAASRLEILASDRDPAVSEAFSEEDYRQVTRILEHYYSICLTDCGTGLLHSAMRGVLGLADQVVLVSSASVDGARSASATLDWLEAHEYGYLVRGAVVVLSMVRTDGKSTIDLDRLEQHFSSRCRAVVRVPWDPHLEEGAEVDLDLLTPATRDAYLQLAATVGEAFAWPR